ncbi:MAG TPA: hypothetical protein PK440_07885 [Candidatus Accumulibacter phosphatis]|nr:MAG: hypothetical protein AW07_03136 [Candidatus Accumulibacter sp. SK-11]HRL76309.1 hypothetical protein [Candidatus Accumulibacter phosphatis]HRQ94905.1 hypothetical protein [Candidatus Accumulibacter phosphatis]
MKAGVTQQDPEAQAATPPRAQARTHRVSAVPGNGFWRAGRHWTRAGTEIDIGDFTEDEWAALTSEPMLVVVAL